MTEDTQLAERPAAAPDGGGTTQDVAPDPMAGIELAAALESLLIIAADPVPEADLAVATGMPVPDVVHALNALAEDYDRQGRGFELRRVSDGWRFYTAARCAPLIHRWLTEGRQSRLSQAALETLAVIAYRQPVSRSQVSSIRGVHVDAVVRTLQSRGLIDQGGEDPLTGAALYVTTDMFLERMGLRDITELPPIVELLPEPDEVADHVDGEALQLP